MMIWIRTHRGTTALMVAVLVAAVAGVVWWSTLPSADDGLTMGDYGADKQREWAELLVGGLNAHDVDRVPLLRSNGKLSVEQRRSIEDVMPGAGCRYELVSVTDRGRQSGQQVPGVIGPRSTYRFDATVAEHCAGAQPTERMLGVVAIAEMGYWDPYYFVPGE